MYFSKHVLEGSFENKMLVLREICREDYLSGKKLFFMLVKRLTMDNMCETRKFIFDCIHAQSCLTL